LKNHISRIIAALGDVCPFLSVVIPAICDRLGHDDIVEPAEEIRLELVILLVLLIEKCDKSASLIANDASFILQHSLLDSYPEVRKVHF
jgi:hypothetical protein